MSAHLRAQWRRRALAGQSRTLYRGLLLGDYSEDDFEREVKRNPTAFVRQHIDTRTLGIHWTWDGDSAYNFATDRDPEGYVHDFDSFGDEDEGGVTVGILIEAEVDEAHVIEEGTEEFADYAMSDAIFDSGHPEHEVTVRDRAPIRIKQVEVIAEGKVEWSQVVPMSMVVAATWQPGPGVLPSGFEVSTGGDAVPGGYNGYLAIFDPATHEKAGYLDWQTESGVDEVLIAMIEVEPQYQRRGLAREMIDYLMRHEFDRPMKLDWGMTTPDGSALRQSYERTAALYTVDVDWSTDKDALKAGELVSGTSRVRVEADNDAEAMLVAQQMVAPREPTDARLVL